MTMNWPNKTERRVRRVLLEMAKTPDVGVTEEELAQRLNMTVEELQGHVQTLINFGWVEARREQR